MTSFAALPQGLQPLTLFFPQAGPGCDVLVAPDLLDVVITTTGSATSTLSLPNTAALVGMSLFHQLVPIEIGAGGALTQVTATNALRLGVGSF